MTCETAGFSYLKKGPRYMTHANGDEPRSSEPLSGGTPQRENFEPIGIKMRERVGTPPSPTYHTTPTGGRYNAPTARRVPATRGLLATVFSCENLNLKFSFPILSEASQIPEEIHIRHCMLLEFHENNNATVATQNICDVYPSALDVRKCQRWFSKFRFGNFALSNSHRSDRSIADELKLVVPDNAKVLDLRELIQESEIYKNDKETYQAIVDCVLEEINDRRNEDENRRNENENRLEIEKLNCHTGQPNSSKVSSQPARRCVRGPGGSNCVVPPQGENEENKSFVATSFLKNKTRTVLLSSVQCFLRDKYGLYMR
ncbi:HTH_48 domain-containing protein [Trichonephila clavipes]|nr:HTH_48 domain-containing protein [Trichonephila clavipes]